MFDERKFNACLALNGISKKQLAAELGMNEATLYRKLQRKGDFSREEINKMISFLKIDNPEEIFFAEQLAYTQD